MSTQGPSLASKLLRIIMDDWEWWHDERSECQFCGTRQLTPLQERHWKHCPRLVWAGKNQAGPADRVARRTGRKDLDWPVPQLLGEEHYRGPYLYNSGAALLEALTEYDPAEYRPRYAEYQRLYAEYKRKRNNP